MRKAAMRRAVVLVTFIVLCSPLVWAGNAVPSEPEKTRKTIVVGADEAWMDKWIDAERVKDAARIIIIPEEKEEKGDYFIEEATISGDMATGKLRVTGRGAVIRGTDVKVYLFSANQDILIRDLTVDGSRVMVAFDKQGYYFIARKKAFSFSGTMEIRDKGQITFTAVGPVNRLAFDLTHGYAVDGDRFGVVDGNVVLQRIYEKTRPTLVQGVFRFSIADVNTFLYRISFQSYGDVIGSFFMDLPNGEQVLTVDGALKWEQKGTRLTLDLTSASAQVVIRGTFGMPEEIRIPVRSGVHYVVIGSDPEKKLVVETRAQEKDLSEAAIEVIYANSRAFLASVHDRFALTVKPLDLLPSLAATSRSTRVTYAVNEKGSMLYEMNCQYQNTGMDYLDVEVTGTPLYAAMQGRPIKLTKDQTLFLSFPKSNHGTFDLVSFVSRRPLGLICLVKLPFPDMDLPITTRTTRLFYPPDYFSVAAFGAREGSEMPEARNVILFLVLICLLGVLLAKDRRFVAWFVIVATGAFYFDIRLFILLVILSLVLIVRRHIERVQFKKALVIIIAVIAVIGLVAFFLSILTPARFRLKSTDRSAARRLADKALTYQAEEMESIPEFKGTVEIGEGAGSITVPTRTGVLPVKFELPEMGKSISVTNHLVTREKHQRITMLLVSTHFKYLLYLLMVIAAWMCYRIYMNRESIRPHGQLPLK